VLLELNVAFTEHEIYLIKDQLMLEKDPTNEELVYWTIDLITTKLYDLETERKSYEKTA
jgi:hypothetical protein